MVKSDAIMVFDVTMVYEKIQQTMIVDSMIGESKAKYNATD